MYNSLETFFTYFMIGLIAFKVFLILLKFIVSRSAIGKSGMYDSQKSSQLEAE